jgi:hypothetical protein
MLLELGAMANAADKAQKNNNSSPGRTQNGTEEG